MSNAIERIRGYCTEVTQAQWEELLRIVKGHRELYHGLIIKTEAELNKKGFGFAYVHGSFLQCESRKLSMFQNPIPFPDFLAKLKGQCHSLKEVGPISFGCEEKWTPKAGEMVDAHYGMGCDWEESIFIGMDGDYYVCRKASYGPSGYRAHAVNDIRPITPTITRAEAEQQLGKRIIDPS